MPPTTADADTGPAPVTRAITIRLPWAAAIRAGVKRVENRGRPIAERHLGELAGIHAGATWSRPGARDPRILHWWFGARAADHDQVDATDFTAYFRAVIAVARIVGCHRATQPTGTSDTCCAPFGDRTYRGAPAWHIQFDDVVDLDPAAGIVGRLSVPWLLTPPDTVRVQDGHQRRVGGPHRSVSPRNA